MRSFVLIVVVLAALGLAAVVFVQRSGGFSTRAEPSMIEHVAARAIRHMSIPASARDAKNPVPFSPEAWSDARAHFADHCASCHGNDGRGQTEMGRNLYPKAPDMRLNDTQNLSDGEIYWIIENGVRLTGMPAWGDGSDNDVDTWKLVHFIRHLSHLTPDDLKEMESLNPKTASELEEERQDREFLEGTDSPAPSAPPTGSHHHKEPS
jgi:mono/diheme cytochrome c family protein